METRLLYVTNENLPALREASKDICVIPMGCVEKHGLHGPLGADIIIARTMSRKKTRIFLAGMKKPKKDGNMKKIELLMDRVGSSKWPQRWETFFDEVEADFLANGTVYTDPDYYQDLHDRLGILNTYLPLYKQAAHEIGKNKDLTLFLALLCRALQDREYHDEDIEQFSAPKRSDSAPDLAYDMLTALAVASEAEMCYTLLQERKLPKEHVEYVMNLPENGVDYYQMRYGRPGYCLLDWYQLAIDCKLFRLGRLELQIFHSFGGRVQVFEGPRGQRVALAHDITAHRSGRALGSLYCDDKESSHICAVCETEDSWVGYPVNEAGLIESVAITLPKREWKQVLKRGDNVVSLHIPAGGGLTPEAVDESIQQMKVFLRTYFPDYEYKAFDCYSWLLDPQLVTLLGEDTNISKFCKRFSPVTHHSRGEAVFNFVFFKPNMDFDMKSLPENTNLEKKLKEHFLNGNAIYETYGYFF